MNDRMSLRVSRSADCAEAALALDGSDENMWHNLIDLLSRHNLGEDRKFAVIGSVSCVILRFYYY